MLALLNHSFSLQADVSQLESTKALEKIETFWHCQKVYETCIIYFLFQQVTNAQTITMWPKLVGHHR